MPSCEFVVRYNAAATGIQLLQSRGRARQKVSEFLVILQVGVRMERREVGVEEDGLCGVGFGPCTWRGRRVWAVVCVWRGDVGLRTATCPAARAW